MRLLLLSNSTMPGEPYLAWAAPHLAELLGKRVERLAFVPYAGVRVSYDDYTDAVRRAFAPLGIPVVGLHEVADPGVELERAGAIAVGGGNTFQLLTQLYSNGLLDPIRKRVREGLPYVGWSAGSNVASPTIRTTNDMPIIEPPSFRALALVPFQVNPHYTEATLPDHGGESRPERLTEFLALNTGAVVAALPEGTALRVEGGQLALVGRAPMVLFRSGEPPEPVPPGSRLERRFPALAPDT